METRANEGDPNSLRSARSFSWVAFLKVAASMLSCCWSSRSLLEWSHFCSLFQRYHANTWLLQRATSSVNMGGFCPLHPQVHSHSTWYTAPTAWSDRVTLGTMYENILENSTVQRRLSGIRRCRHFKSSPTITIGSIYTDGVAPLLVSSI